MAKLEAALERRLERSLGPKDGGPALRRGSVRYEVSDRVQTFGLRRDRVDAAIGAEPRLAEAIDRRVGILKGHLPYHESDHVLNWTHNILSGVECPQDVEGAKAERKEGSEKGRVPLSSPAK